MHLQAPLKTMFCGSHSVTKHLSARLGTMVRLNGQLFDHSRPVKSGSSTRSARLVHNVLDCKHDHTLMTVRLVRSFQPPEPKEFVEHGGFSLELGRG